jgi:hypothetical protein
MREDVVMSDDVVERSKQRLHRESECAIGYRSARIFSQGKT